MTRNIGALLVAAVVALSLVAGAEAGKGERKSKPGSGGGGGSVPAGTIFHAFQGAGFASMAADGSSKTAITLGATLRPVPAHVVHSGEQWYAARRSYEQSGQTYKELVAVRQDGLVVPLWYEVGAHVSFTRWAKDDSFLVFKVLRPFNGAAAETAEVLRIGITWVDGAPVPGTVEELVAETPDDQAPYRFDVSPDGTELVYNLASSNELWIEDLRTGALRLLAPVGLDPEWSHDGTRIAYVWDALHTIAPDGTGDSVLLQGEVGLMGWCRFSPDDKHIAFIQERLVGKGRNKRRVKDIMRIASTGGTAVSLSDDVDADAVRVVAWR